MDICVERGDIMNTLSSKHLFFVILGVALVSLETYPSIYVNLGGRDSWIAMIAASFIFFFLCFICYEWHKKY